MTERIFSLDRELLKKVSACSFAMAALAAPFSTALLNVTCIVGFILWAVGVTRADFRRLLRRPVACLFIAFSLVLLLSIFWASVPLNESLPTLSKYRKLLYCPAVLCLCLTWPAFRIYFFRIFYAALYLLAFASVAVALQIPGFSAPDPYQGAIFMKSHITEGFLMGVFTLMNGYLLVFDGRRATRVLAAAGLGLGCLVVFYLINGRTGYLSVAVALLSVLLFAFKDKRQLLVALGALTVVAAVVFLTSERVQGRLNDAAGDIHGYWVEGNDRSSMGLRLSFWVNGGKIFLNSPLLGNGVGSFESEMNKLADRADELHPIPVTGNAHNDFIMVAVQTGLLGLTLWLVFLWRLYRFPASFPDRYRLLIRGFIALYVTGAFFNSYLLDFTEGTVAVLIFGVLMSLTDKNTIREKSYA